MGKTMIVQIFFLQIDLHISTKRFYVNQAMIKGLSATCQKRPLEKSCICNNKKSIFKIV